MHPKLRVIIAASILIVVILIVNYILLQINTRFGKKSASLNQIMTCAVVGTCGMAGTIIIIVTLFLLIPQRWINIFDMISQPYKMVKDIHGQDRIIPKST